MVIGSNGNSVLPNLNLMHVFCLKLHVSCYDTFIVNMQVLCFLQVLGVLEIMNVYNCKSWLYC